MTTIFKMVNLNIMTMSRQNMVTSSKDHIFMMFYEVTVRDAFGDEAEIQKKVTGSPKSMHWRVTKLEFVPRSTWSQNPCCFHHTGKMFS